MHRGIQQERKVTPSAVASEGIKKTSLVSLDTGIDAHTGVNGRKRHLDSLGYPGVLCVRGANVSDNDIGRPIVCQVASLVDSSFHYSSNDIHWRA